ncbi:MAG: sigma-70 family RNA polymerase sigma factor, partial [Longimicrobiales bacterium]|nr:sigma-70 family RNA polymerase sigma factor [Longimicrobiales bacterium]
TGEDPGARLRLERAIASLPERARMAIVLHGVEGYSYEEVAELMGVALGTVKSHIHRARTLLIERLEDG